MTLTDRRYGVAEGLAYKAPVRLATTGPHAGAGLAAIDGVTPAEGDPILRWRDDDETLHGIWLASSGAWTRRPDFDGARDVVRGTRVAVTDGTANGGAVFAVSAANPVLPGTSNISFENVTPGREGFAVGTREQVEATAVPVLALYIRTAGYSVIGDAGGALYKRVGSEPSHPGKVQSADEAWWEIAEVSLVPRMLGANPNDGDSYQQLQDTLDTMSALGGGVVWIDSIYRTSAELLVPVSVSVRGESPGACAIISTSATANTLRFVGRDGVVVMDIALDVAEGVTKTGGTALKLSSCTNLIVDNVEIRRPYVGAHSDASTSLWLSRLRVTYPVATYGIGILVDGVGNDQYLDRCFIKGVSDEQPRAGIEIRRTGAIWLTGNGSLWAGKGLWVNVASGEAVEHLFLDSNAFDSCDDEGALLEAASGATIHRVSCTADWFATNAGAGFKTTGAGVIKGVRLKGIRSWNNQLEGVSWQAGTDLSLSAGSVVGGNGGAASNTYDEIAVAAGITNFAITDNFIGETDDFACVARYGISVAAGAGNRYRITGNQILGAVTAAISDGGTGFDKLVDRNIEEDSSGKVSIWTRVPQALAFMGIITPTQILASQNNFAPVDAATGQIGVSRSVMANLFSDAAYDITGLAGLAINQEYTLFNGGSYTLTLINNSGSSSAGNKFQFGGDVPLPPGGGVTLWKDIAGNIRLKNNPLVNTGVTAGSYGGAAQIPVITVGADGRVSAASTGAALTQAAIAAGAIANGSTATTQAVDTNNTTLATCAYVDRTKEVLKTNRTSDLALNNTATFFDALSITLTTGTWLVHAHLQIHDTAGPAAFAGRLTDGTNVEDEGALLTIAANEYARYPLMGIFVGPVTVTAQIKDSSSTNGVVKADLWASGNNKDTVMIATRIK